MICIVFSFKIYAAGSSGAGFSGSAGAGSGDSGSAGASSGAVSGATGLSSGAVSTFSFSCSWSWS